LDVNPEWYRVYAGPVVTVDLECESYIQGQSGLCEDFRFVKIGDKLVLIPNQMELMQDGYVFSCMGSDASMVVSPNCFQAVVNLIKTIATTHLAKLSTDGVEYDVVWACVEFNEEAQ
jgi:hypothetical protein